MEDMVISVKNNELGAQFLNNYTRKSRTSAEYVFRQRLR